MSKKLTEEQKQWKKEFRQWKKKHYEKWVEAVDNDDFATLMEEPNPPPKPPPEE